MSHDTLIRATRPLPQNWVRAYNIAIYKPVNFLKREWSCGENADGMEMFAKFTPGPNGSVTITLTPESGAGKGLVQRHEHLRSSRVFTPYSPRQRKRQVQGVSGFASRPIVGQDLDKAPGKVMVEILKQIRAIESEALT
jgi:hypothetical protein